MSEVAMTAQAGKEAFSVPEFCELHGISRRLLYTLWSKGQGPRRLRVGDRVLIPKEAAAEWRAGAR